MLLPELADRGKVTKLPAVEAGEAASSLPRPRGAAWGDAPMKRGLLVVLPLVLLFDFFEGRKAGAAPAAVMVGSKSVAGGATMTCSGEGPTAVEKGPLAKGSGRTCVGERARARARAEGLEGGVLKGSLERGTGWRRVMGEGGREVGSSSMMAYSDRARSVAFGGRVRRDSGEVAMGGASTRTVEEVRWMGRVEASLRELRRWPEVLARRSLLLTLSVDECFRERELGSLLLHGSTSRRKNLVPGASKYGFEEGSCAQEK